MESAADGNTALNRIRAQAPDVLVTDINMPYVNGDELAAAVQSEFPDRRFPIFVMSSMSAPENRTWISQIPGAVFIPKPLRTRDLIARLAAYAAAR